MRAQSIEVTGLSAIAYSLCFLAALLCKRRRPAEESKPKRILFRTAVATAIALELTITVSAAQSASAAQSSLAQQTAGLSMIDKAWNEIYCNPRDSLRIFNKQLPKWAAFSKQSVGYIDADRGSLIAAVLAEDDLAARASWSRISQESGVVAEVEPSGDVRAWNNEWTAAFRSYRNAGQFGTADCTVETNRGLDDAISGHLQQARTVWLAQQVCFGPYDLTDVHLALMGDAFAAQNKWPAARSTWILAARKGRTVPQLAMLYSGNIMALSMLFHYRDRFVAATAGIKTWTHR